MTGVWKKLGIPAGGALLFCSLAYFVLGIRGDYRGLHERLKKIGVFAGMASSREEVLNNAKNQSLNFILPDFSAIANYALGLDEGARAVFLGRLESYFQYYEAVQEHYPDMAEVYLVLAFLQFEKGDIGRSLALLEKAASIDPDFFWTQYDLGIVYYHLRQVDQAAIAFRKALAQDPRMTLEKMSHSKVYLQLLSGIGSIPYEPSARIRPAYKIISSLMSADAVTPSKDYLKLRLF